MCSPDAKFVSMSEAFTEVLRVSMELGVKVKVLSQKQSEEVVKAVVDKYTKKGLYLYPLWENLINALSYKSESAWKHLSILFPGQPKLLFFELDDSRQMIEFSNSNDLVFILENTFAFVIYVTDISIDYLVCFNDHDYLICCGSAKDYLITNH